MTLPIIKRVGIGVLALVVVLLIVGQLLGQPILLGYVATESMEPTMEAGDGFIAVPSVVADSPSAGDVVVFEARELHDGGLTTHRIVGETEEGYVTKGDGNPFTDQDGDEPPVTEGQIVAVALQIDGEVVTIPHLGTVVMGIHGVAESAVGSASAALGMTTTLESDGLGALLVGIGVALLGFGILLDRRGGMRSTTRVRSRENVYAFWSVVGVVLLLVVTFTTAAMVVPSGVHEYEVVSTDSPTDDPQILEPGASSELTRSIDNAGYVPIVVVTEAESRGVKTEPSSQTVGMRGTGETTVTLSAPEETGTYARHVGEYRYLTLLPPSVLVALHGVHPLLAIGAVNGVVVGVVVGAILVLFGSGDFRLRRPGGDLPPSTRLRRRVRRWIQR